MRIEEITPASFGRRITRVDHPSAPTRSVRGLAHKNGSRIAGAYRFLVAVRGAGSASLRHQPKWPGSSRLQRIVPDRVEPFLMHQGREARERSAITYRGTALDAGLFTAPLDDLPSMLCREHVCIKGGNPHLALLGDSKVAQSMFDIRSHHLPEKVRIICPQIGSTTVFQYFAHSCLAKLVK